MPAVPHRPRGAPRAAGRWTAAAAAVAGALPRGGTLPRATWELRHRWLVRLLVLGAAAVVVRAAWTTSPVWATAAGRAGWDAASTRTALGLGAAVCLVLVLTAVASARWARLRRARADQLRAGCATTGVMACAVLGPVLSGGAFEAHLLLYVAVPLIALHEAWTPYLAAAVTALAAHAAWALEPVVHGHGAGDLQRGAAGDVLVHTALLSLALAGALLAWKGAESARAATEERVAELRHRARHDALTGLLDRRGAALALDAALGPAGGPGAEPADEPGADRTRPLALVLFDLDGFKDVNDALGHSAGDELLTRVASVLRRAAAATDRAAAATDRATGRATGAAQAVTTARLGGDEFAALLPGVGAEQGAALAHLVARGLRAGVRVAGVCVEQRISAGVTAHLGGSALDAAGRAGLAEELLRRADVALYAAKAGDDDVVVHDAALDERAARRTGLARDLRTALARDDQLLLHFQPQVCLVGEDAGQVVGVEAFARWRHPQHGLLLPGDFLEAVAACGAEHRLTEEVVRLALVQVGRWADAGCAVPVAVNASRHCLVRPGFVPLVAAALAEHRVAPSLLRIEITEDDVAQDPQLALEAITDLRAMGVGVSVDDFGTGYSSLAHLRRLPVEEVKLDRSFVAGLGVPDEAGNADEVLVESVIALAHRLGVRVVAEGVERPEEAAVLRRLGCDVVQGRLVAPPTAAGPLPPLVTVRRGAGDPVCRGEDARAQQPISSGGRPRR